MIKDLTRVLSNTTIPYPGSPWPQLKRVSEVIPNGAAETNLNINSHHGTHMDAPAHMYDGGKTLDLLDVSMFTGRAYVLDASAAGENGRIGTDMLPDLSDIDFLLISTGWENFWGDDKYYQGYPVLSHEAADMIAKSNLKGVGYDVSSADPVSPKDFYSHHTLFPAGKIIVENLCSLIPLRGSYVRFTALPMLFENSDGAPCRAIAEY